MLKGVERFWKARAEVEERLWLIEWLWDAADEGEEFIVEKLHSSLTEDPVLVIEGSRKIRSGFEEVVENPAGGYVRERKRSMLSVSMARLLRSEKTRGWALSLYPKLLEHLYHVDPEVEKWAVHMLGDIARLCPEKTVEAGRKLFEKYFNPSTELTYEPPAITGLGADGYRGEVAKENLSELSQIFHRLPKEEKTRILDELKRSMKDGDEGVKLKAKYLLQSII